MSTYIKARNLCVEFPIYNSSNRSLKKADHSGGHRWKNRAGCEKACGDSRVGWY